MQRQTVSKMKLSLHRCHLLVVILRSSQLKLFLESEVQKVQKAKKVIREIRVIEGQLVKTEQMALMEQKVHRVRQVIQQVMTSH